MHSRIYCLVETQKTNKNYKEDKENSLDLIEDEVYENMQSVVDYVSDETDLKSDIDWLKEVYNNNLFIFTSETTFKLNVKEIEKYFNEKIDELKKKVNNITTIEKFFHDSYSITKLINDKFNCWFIIDDSYETFDDFLKYYITKKEYEIVKSFDYHF